MKLNPGKMLCRSYIIVQHTTVCALYKYNKSTSSKGQPPARREDELTYIDKDWRIHVVTYHIFQNKCMYNRFPLKMKKEWPREKREKDGTEEGGSPKKEKKRKRKTEKPRPLSLCVVCYSDTFPRSFIHTHIRSTTHTHTHIYIYTNVIYIYKHREVLQTWSSESCQRRQRPSWKTLRTKWWWFTAQSLISIVSFIKTSNGQHISCRYFIVISPSTCLWWPNDRIPMTNHGSAWGTRLFRSYILQHTIR